MLIKCTGVLDALCTAMTVLCLEYDIYSCDNSSFTPACGSCLYWQNLTGNLTPRGVSIFLLPVCLQLPQPSLLVGLFLPMQVSTWHVWWGVAGPIQASFGLSQDHPVLSKSTEVKFQIPCLGDVYWSYTGNDVTLCKCGPNMFKSQQWGKEDQTDSKNYPCPEEYGAFPENPEYGAFPENVMYSLTCLEDVFLKSGRP